MRQAGRSLPEYRAIRERHAFFDINRSAELTAEVTLQPVRRHGVDAAVLFADIMLPVIAMGIDVDLVEGVGPVIANPVRTLADVEALRVPEPEEAVPFVLETVRLVRDELEPELTRFGQRVATDILELGRKAQLTEPELVPYDPWGRRVDEIRVSDAWKELDRISAEEGIVATGYERKYGAWSRLLQFAPACTADLSAIRRDEQVFEAGQRVGQGKTLRQRQYI